MTYSELNAYEAGAIFVDTLDTYSNFNRISYKIIVRKTAKTVYLQDARMMADGSFEGYGKIKGVRCPEKYPESTVFYGKPLTDELLKKEAAAKVYIQKRIAATEAAKKLVSTLINNPMKASDLQKIIDFCNNLEAL